jgi:accessory gene regulator protein AgrB
MLTFSKELKFRNEEMFYFGLLCLGLAILFLNLTKTTSTEVVSLFYGLLAIFVRVQALQGGSFLNAKGTSKEVTK